MLLGYNEKYPLSTISLKYVDDYNSQGHGQFLETFKAFTKDDILQPSIHLITNLDHLILVMILDIIYMFSIYDIKRT